MATNNQWHDEDAARFLMLFNKLRAATGDDASSLMSRAGTDESFRRLCLEVASAAWPLWHAERRVRERFMAPVNPKFIEAWRQFEAHYFAPLGVIEFAEMDLDISGTESESAKAFDRRCKFAAEEARDLKQSLECGLQFVEDQTNQTDLYDDDFLETLKRSASAWKQLTQECGLDVEGVFFRRELIPFTLIPSHVSNFYGAEKLSLFTHLKQAHDAFVFGVPFAALALMRAIAEVVLQKHYGASGQGFKAMIKSVHTRLPEHLIPRLRTLKKLADDILHSKSEERMPANIEREIALLLINLRELIENAPHRNAVESHPSTASG